MSLINRSHVLWVIFYVEIDIGGDLILLTLDKYEVKVRPTKEKFLNGYFGMKSTGFWLTISS